MGSRIRVPSPFSDLYDQISITKLKIERLSDSPELPIYKKTLEELLNESERFSDKENDAFASMKARLHDINSQLWSLETEIRTLDRESELVKIADITRHIINLNDQRAEVKKEIAIFLGSPLVEEKSHKLGTSDCLVKESEPPLLLVSDLGSVLDKISILELKKNNCTSPIRQANCEKELNQLESIRREVYEACSPGKLSDLVKIQNALRVVNEQMWHIQDDMRTSHHLDNDDVMAKLGLGVIDTNAKRNELKKEATLLTPTDEIECDSFPSKGM